MSMEFQYIQYIKNSNSLYLMYCRNHFFYLFGYQHSAKIHFDAEFEFAESTKCFQAFLLYLNCSSVCSVKNFILGLIRLFFNIILPFNILFSIKCFQQTLCHEDTAKAKKFYNKVVSNIAFKRSNSADCFFKEQNLHIK